MVGVARRHGQPSHMNTLGLFVCGPVDWSVGELWWSMNSKHEYGWNQTELRVGLSGLKTYAILLDKSLWKKREKYFIGHTNAEMQAVEGTVIRSSEEDPAILQLVWLNSMDDELKMPLGSDTFMKTRKMWNVQFLDVCIRSTSQVVRHNLQLKHRNMKTWHHKCMQIYPIWD